MGRLVLMTAGAVMVAALSTGCTSARRAAQTPTPERAVGAVLDTLHWAAANAEESVYFDLFTPDAVFLGTDATERWPIDTFRAWAEPYFARDSAWVYRVLERHVVVAPGGRTAWFDERLWNDRLGETRGSGVLQHDGGRWRIAQYNLSMVIPNELADEVAARVREAAGGEPR
ncbi:MAG: DUF4440 domain-containing protein [Planctomycetota bacterium]|nr:MAG: DUF4440 domain-containing protein [Planctomycetota bacterium]